MLFYFFFLSFGALNRLIFEQTVSASFGIVSFLKLICVYWMYILCCVFRCELNIQLGARV